MKPNSGKVTMRSQREFGKLIVLEGPDGVGKTTLAHELISQLTSNGVKCKYYAFPGRQKGTLGELVYRLHHQAEMFGIEKLRPTSLQALHVAAHIEAIESILLPSLARGTWFVLDRFWWSTWVYGLLSGMDHQVLETLIEVERKCWKGVTPLLVAVIEREVPCRNEENNGMWRPRVEAYRELTKREHRHYPVRCINNDRSIQAVAAEIRATALQLNNKPTKDLRPQLLDEQLTLALRPFHVRASPVVVAPSQTQPLEKHATKVLDAYWRFAAERQAIFFRRFRGEPLPWTNDRILLQHKFTNAYRASDRVSQFLIRHVIYNGEQTESEAFFRTILFKIFNRITTWRLLESELGVISYREYNHKRYNSVLSKIIDRGEQIYSAAYIMPPAERTEGERKHTGHLRLLERMMKDKLFSRLADSQTLQEAFEHIRAYPMMGNFLAYQYLIDLNYGPLLNFSEMDFIVPGPGARRGISKCFADIGRLSEADVIRLVTEHQEEAFAKRNIKFETLWGRSLQLIDCQNLFCEIDKYARVAFPDLQTAGGRKRIKQTYRPTDEPIDYWYPPKWGLNEKIQAARRF